MNPSYCYSTLFYAIDRMMQYFVPSCDATHGKPVVFLSMLPPPQPWQLSPHGTPRRSPNSHLPYQVGRSSTLLPDRLSHRGPGGAPSEAYAGIPLGAPSLPKAPNRHVYASPRRKQGLLTALGRDPPMELHEIFSRHKERSGSELYPRSQVSVEAAGLSIASAYEVARATAPRCPKYLLQDSTQQRRVVWSAFQLDRMSMLTKEQQESKREQPAKPKKPRPKRKKKTAPTISVADDVLAAWSVRVAAALRQHLEKSHERVRDALVKFDSDGSGTLDATEFCCAIYELGIPETLKMPEEETAQILEEVFAAFDLDSSGTVEFSELKQVLRADCKLAPIMQPGAVESFQGANFRQTHTIREKEEWKALERFGEMDLDGSGCVSMRELHSFCSSEGYSTKFTEQLMAALDADASGSVDKEEWRLGVLKLKGSSLLNSMTDPKEPPSKTVFTDLYTPRNIWLTGAYDVDHNFKTLVPEERQSLGRKGVGCEISEPEHRAILLSQLRALVMHVKRRCEIETWKDSMDKRMNAVQVNHYDVVAYITKPVTRARKCSYVEAIASQAQRPNWFVSHAWCEPVSQFFACLDQHARDRSLDLSDTAYWICVYALSPWKFGEGLPSVFDQSVLHRAMSLCSGTVSIVSELSGSVDRTWVCFEVYVAVKTSDERPYHYDMYTAFPHKLQGELVTMPEGPDDQPPHFVLEHLDYERGVKVEGLSAPRNAVGLCDGLCFHDSNSNTKMLRESHFPGTRLVEMLKRVIESTTTTVDTDRISILNTITKDRALDADPARSHPMYDEVNGLVRGRLVNMCLERCLDSGGTLLAAMNDALSASTLRSFVLDGQVKRQRVLTRSVVESVLESLPLTLEELRWQMPPNIETMPEGMLSRLRRLQRLELQGSKGLKALPPDIVELSSLTSLDLSDMEFLEELPPKLLDLRLLQSLNLTRCISLSTITARGASRCALTSLIMEGCTSLHHLPDTLGINLAGLQQLDMRGCAALDKLPNWVAELERQAVAIMRPEHLT